MTELPPLPDVSYIAYYDGQEKMIHAAMRDYAVAAVKAYKASLKPVAWGVPNSRITERQPFMSLLHELPKDGGVDGRRKTPLYEAMLVPLYRLDKEQTR